MAEVLYAMFVKIKKVKAKNCLFTCLWTAAQKPDLSWIYYNAFLY